MAEKEGSSSSGFRGLQKHIDQDRSLQSDRIQGSSRDSHQRFSSATYNPSAEQAFAAHQMSQLSLDDHSRLQLSGNLPVMPAGSHAGLLHAGRGIANNSFAAPAVANPLNEGPTQAATHMTAHAHAGSLNNRLHHLKSPDVPNFTNAGPQSFPAFGSFAMPQHIPQHMPQMPQMPQFNPFQPQAMSIASQHADQNFDPMHQNRVEMHEERVRAAYEAEFDAAMDEWMQSQAVEDVSQQTPYVDQSATADHAAESAAGSQPLGRTELANAAQQLVDAVSDNTSTKFQQSNFIEMMKRIASQEVVIEGNALVEAPAAANTTSSAVATESAFPSHVTGARTGSSDSSYDHVTLSPESVKMESPTKFNKGKGRASATEDSPMSA